MTRLCRKTCASHSKKKVGRPDRRPHHQSARAAAFASKCRETYLKEQCKSSLNPDASEEGPLTRQHLPCLEAHRPPHTAGPACHAQCAACCRRTSWPRLSTVWTAAPPPPAFHNLYTVGTMGHATCMEDQQASAAGICLNNSHRIRAHLQRLLHRLAGARHLGHRFHRRGLRGEGLLGGRLGCVGRRLGVARLAV